MRGSRGFVDLSVTAEPSLLGRHVLGGALLGLCMGLAALHRLQQAVDEAQASLAQARAEWTQQQAAQARIAKQASGSREASAQVARMQAAQQGRVHLLAILDDLAQVPGPALTLLRLDAQGLRLQGQAEAASLEAWALQRPSVSVGLGPPELIELMPAPSPAATLRFVLQWPVGVGQGER